LKCHLPDVDGKVLLATLTEQHVEVVVEPLRVRDALLVPGLLVLKPVQRNVQFCRGIVHALQCIGKNKTIKNY
jgi:hypothetical protein